MKITEIEIFRVKPRWIFCKISTDAGISGWGEMISGTKTETVVAGAYEIGNRVLVGQDPFDIERLWQRMHRSFFRGGPIQGTIVSGFEMALWIFLNIVGVENPALVKIIQIFNNVWEAAYAIPLIIHANIAVLADGGDNLFGVNIGADTERIIGFFAV